MRSNGGLAEFNAEFKRPRMVAQKTGAYFPAYSLALSRLRRAMAAHAPGAAGAISHTLLEMVFAQRLEMIRQFSSVTESASV
jgi:hypothetical protein